MKRKKSSEGKLFIMEKQTRYSVFYKSLFVNRNVMYVCVHERMYALLASET